MLASAPARSLNQIATDLGIPRDSIKYGKTLALYDADRDAPVLGAALARGVVADRMLVAVAFGLEPILTQSAYFRPHNQSEEVEGLFLVAFLASSLVRLWPGPRTRALLARRRALGLAFATAHFIHFCFMVWIS